MMAFLGIVGTQAFLIGIDEFIFHRKRTLPKWERWGHPLDTFFMILPISFLVLSRPANFFLYAAFAVFSCLFVTKDEWVHSKYCKGPENWIHSLLFLIHPLVFMTAWTAHFESPHLLRLFLPVPIFFMFYQIYYWNFYENKFVRNRSKNH